MVLLVISNERSTQLFRKVRYNNIAVRWGRPWENTMSASAAAVTPRRTSLTNAHEVVSLGALKLSFASIFWIVQHTVEQSIHSF